VTQTESDPRRHARRTAPPAAGAGLDLSSEQNRITVRPASPPPHDGHPPLPVAPPLPSSQHQPQARTELEDDEHLDPDRRGSHATGYGQGFSWVLTWTILGALLPGSGLIAAGSRRIGGVLVGVLGLAGLGLVMFALFGRAGQRAISFVAESKNLLILASSAAIIGVIWAVVVLLTNHRLRRFATLTPAQTVFSWIVVAALVAGIALPTYKVSSYALILRDVTTSAVFAGQEDQDGSTTAKPATHKTDPWADVSQVNVLLIGSDAGRGRKGIRPDTLILASINPRTGKTVMFSVPRSLQRAPFPAGTGGHRAWPNGYYCPQAGPGAECLINAIWSWAAEGPGRQYYSKFKNPGLRATEDAVEGVTGLKIDTHVMLNLMGFRDFVDALGGVTIDIHSRLPIGGNGTLGDPEYHVATGGWLEKGNNQKLDGYHALWFARSRWLTGDYDRMQRQRCAIGALVDQADPLTAARKFPAIATALKENLSLGIQSRDIPAWIDLAQRIKAGGVTSLVLDPDVINTVNPDIDEIHRLVAKAVKATGTVKKPATAASPSPGASAAATAKPKPSGPKKPVDPKKAQDLQAVC
jgi:LCP family protein required for cell wall assembly